MRAAARTAVLAGAALLCGVAGATPNLMVAVSKRLPTPGEVVRLAAYWDGWEGGGQPQRPVVISVEWDGRTRVVGKTTTATDPGKPFEPSVEWIPGATGLYTVIARADNGPVALMRVPVTAQPTYFCWYGPTRPDVQWMTHHLTARQEEVPALHARGVVALKHAGGVSYVGGPRPEDIQWDVDMAAVGARIVQDYTQVEPFDGIAIDELGLWEDHPQQARLAQGYEQALAEARKRRPDLVFAAWQFGSLNPLMCNLLRDNVDLILCEVYQNHFRAWQDQHRFAECLRQRIEMARQMDVSKKTLMGLAITRGYGGARPDEIEEQIRFIRATGPEIRGLAFFWTGDATEEAIRTADDCCYRYWVKPALALFEPGDVTLSDTQPVDGGTLKVLVTVHNVGGTEARRVRVRLWDGDPAGGGKLVGENVIPRLPAARWVDPEARDDQSIEPPEAMRRDGFGMETVSFAWTARRGPHALWAEIVPDEKITLIEGFQCRRVTVR